MRYKVLKATSMKTAVLWDVAPNNLIDISRRFTGSYCLHHQGDASVNIYRTTQCKISEGSHLESELKIKRGRTEESVDMTSSL